MKRLIIALCSAAMFFGVTFAVAPTASAAHAGTGPVVASAGMKWTPTPGAFTWFGVLPNWCTMTAVGTDAQDNLIGITAAHCVANQSVGAPIHAYNNNLPALVNPAIGELAYKNSDAAYDIAVIKFYPDRVTLHQQGPNLNVTHVANPVVGQAVCKDGATTGESCGTIVSVTGNEIKTTSFAASGGDSGAPLVVTGTDAVVGLLRGPSSACPVICPPDGLLFRSVNGGLATLPAGTPGVGFVATTNP